METSASVIVATLALGGCSWVGVHGPAAPPATCTSNYALPILDGALAIVVTEVASKTLLSPVWNVGQGICHDCGPGVILGALALGAGVAFGVSGIQGFQKVSQCRTANDQDLALYQSVVAPPRVSPPAATTTFYCSTSPNGAACFCSQVEDDCNRRAQHIIELGGPMSACAVSATDRCKVPRAD